MYLFLICVSAFVVSGDVFFVVHIGGFTVRFFQIAMLPIILKGLLVCLQRPVRPVGFQYLVIWTAFVLLFVPNTTLLNRSVFYGVWLLFNVLVVLGVTAVVDTPAKCSAVLQWYIYSFAFSAVFGLSQVLLPLVGISPILVQQWWSADALARINGFTYEPSYYATYILTGWVLVDYLRYRKYPLRYLGAAYWLMTSALILCGSRAGWLVMLLWLAIRVLWYLKERRSLRKSLVFVVGVAIVSIVTVSSGLLGEAGFLIRGLGIMDNDASYSSQGRWDIAMQTLHIYINHPIIGVSLGGIAPAIARQNYSTVADNDDAKANEGMCTTLEVLAASGTIGFCFYVLYMTRLIRQGFRSGLNSPVVKSFVWALVFSLLILQIDQNILRSYVWLHIGLLSAACRVFSTSGSTAANERFPLECA